MLPPRSLPIAPVVPATAAHILALQATSARALYRNRLEPRRSPKQHPRRAAALTHAREDYRGFGVLRVGSGPRRRRAGLSQYCGGTAHRAGRRGFQALCRRRRASRRAGARNALACAKADRRRPSDLRRNGRAAASRRAALQSRAARGDRAAPRYRADRRRACAGASADCVSIPTVNPKLRRFGFR